MELLLSCEILLLGLFQYLLAEHYAIGRPIND
jgi:hypothetical protein